MTRTFLYLSLGTCETFPSGAHKKLFGFLSSLQSTCLYGQLSKLCLKLMPLNSSTFKRTRTYHLKSHLLKNKLHLKAQMTRVLLFNGLLTLFCSSPSSILPFQNPKMVVMIHHLVTTSLVGGGLSVLRVTSPGNCFSTCIMCTSCCKKCCWRGSWISMQPKSSSATMSISSSLFL